MAAKDKLVLNRGDHLSRCDCILAVKNRVF